MKRSAVVRAAGLATLLSIYGVAAASPGAGGSVSSLVGASIAPTLLDARRDDTGPPALSAGPVTSAVGAVSGVAAGAASDPYNPARLGFQWIAGETRPELLLAQRTIDREWGPSGDSVYVELDIPGWKSEPLAAGLSAVLPGSGQAYVGDGSAWVYAAIEVAGWGGWLWYRHDAASLNSQAEGVAGVPVDLASGWTYDRWATATGGDPTYIAGLYAVDRQAYLTAIGSDPRYAGGWTGEAIHSDFLNLRDHADSRLHRSRIYGTALWINHLVAAANALRSARLHNMPLAHNVGMRIEPRLHGGRAGVMMTLVRKF